MHIMAHGSVPAGPRELLPLNSTRGMTWYPTWKEQQFTQLQKSLVLLTVLISRWPRAPSKILSGPIKDPNIQVTALVPQSPGVHTRSPWTMQIRPKLDWTLFSVISFQTRYYTKSETPIKLFYSSSWQSSLVLNSSLKVNKPQDACCLKQ